MVAIFTGAGTGYERGSGNLLGGVGTLGSAALGRSGEQVMLNAATGNLLITQRDEFLIGRGPDAVVNRTYNSLGDLSDDNHDNWRQSTQRQIRDLTGTVNTWGSTVKRVSGDGSIVTYAWNGSKYQTTAGAGAHDALTYDGTWRWTDGDSQTVEVYGGPANQISQLTDTSGNTITYSYSGGQLADVTTSNGERIHYAWSGNNLVEIQTVYNDAGTWKQLTRTRYEYDGYNRLVTVAVDLTPEDNSTSDGNRYVTSYTYHGTSKLVASIAQTDGTRLDIGYDVNNRVSTLTQTVSAGVTRTTTIGYGANYTNIIDPQGQATRLDYANGDFAVPLETWGFGGQTSEPAMIGDSKAVRYTVSPGAEWAGVSQVFEVAAGDTVTFALTLQAVGSTTAQVLGLYSDQTGWGTTGISSARIVSGPGYLTQNNGGEWQVSDLSTTIPTRVEITRTFDQAGSGGAYFYNDHPSGIRTGSQLLAANPMLTRSATATSLVLSDLGNWGYDGVSRESAGTINGAAAYKYTAQQTGHWAGISTGLVARAGEQLAWSMTLQAVGSETTQDLGLYGNVSGWGDPSWANARIVSGPGTITNVGGGIFRVSGLSTTQPTRVQIVRTYDRDEAGGAYLYVDLPNGFRGGVSLIAAAPQLTRLSSQWTGSGGQLTKITTVAPNSGTAPQVVEFGYDAAGNLASVTNAAGTTTYTYDERGNVLQVTDPAGLSTWRTYNAANQLLVEMRAGATANGDDVYNSTRYAYDSANRLRFVMDADGGVTEYGVGAYGRTEWTRRVVAAAYDTTSWNWDTPLDHAAMAAWVAAADHTGSERIDYVYDARLNLTQKIPYGRTEANSAPSTVDGYTHEYFTYDQAGQLLSRRTAGVNAATFVYDGLGRVKASTDSAGAATSIVFNDAATQTVVTLASGLVRTATYNRAGELINQSESGTYTNGGATTYAYDSLGRVRKATDPNGVSNYVIYDKLGRKVGDVNAYGWLTEYRYDAVDRLVATVRYALGMDAAQQAQAFDPAASPDIAALRPAGHPYDIWQWTVYDAAGRVVESIQGDGAVTRFEYDRSDRLVRTTQFANKLSQAQLDGFKTAAPTALVLPPASGSDSVARTFYDRSGRIIGALDGEGWLTRIVYDKAGRKIAETVFASLTNASLRSGGTFNQLVASVGTHPKDATTRYVYDGQGHLRFTVDALNRVVEHGYQYDTPSWNWAWSAHGPERVTTQFAGTIAVLGSYTMDSVRQALANAGLVGNAANRSSYAVYDDYHGAAGRLMYTVSADGAVVGYKYDSSGRLIRKTEYANRRGTPHLPSQGDMDAWVATYGAAGDRVERYYYNARGEMRFAIDAEGYVTRNDYDAAGQLTYTARWTNAVAANDGWTIDTVAANQSGDFAATSYAYNLDKQVSRVTDPSGNIKDYYFHATGRVAHEILNDSSADDSRTVFVYDAAGKMRQRYDAHGLPEQSVTSYAYDGLGNVTTVTDGRGLTTTSTYDKAGQLRTVTDVAGGVTTYSYNAFGQVVQVTDPRGAVTTTTYDSAGQAISVTDALGYVTSYTYDTFGAVASVTRAGATTSFEYDKLGRVTKSTDALGYYEAYTYDAPGNRVTSRNKLGGMTSYAYDRRGLLVGETLPITAFDNNGNAVASTVTNTYAYDSRGNRVTMVEAAGLAEARTTTYAYDKSDRLTATSGPAFFGMTPTSYLQYDGRGNVTARIDPAGARTAYFYDDLDRVVVEISAVGTYTAHSYDANGNIVSTRVYATVVGVPADGGAQAEAPGAPGGGYRETTFAYDGLNRLTSSTIAGATSGRFDGAHWVVDGGGITVGYQYDAAGNVVKATDAVGNVTWSWHDLLGRKTHQVDGENYLTSWSYDAEGNVTWDRRYAIRVTGAPTLSTPPAIVWSGEDRQTSFTYDLVGNRLSESRHSVLVHDGSGGQTWATAVVSYLYNGLGQVVRKTEGTGDQTNYTYDNAGRLVTEQRAAFVDHSGATVTPTVDYYYNGVGDLARTRARGSTTAAERVTTYGYLGSKLYWMRSAEAQSGDVTDGKLTYYGYDVAGRQIEEYYQRWNSAGASYATYEGWHTVYDAAGRVSVKSQGEWNPGTGWIDVGPRTGTSYNAYGEVTGVSVSGIAQLENQYDAAGRMVATNADGGWQYFGYDKNGNQTIAIASAGYNLAGAGFAGALSLIGREDVNATCTNYDGRNMAVTVTEEGRRLHVGGAAHTLITQRAYNAYGEVASETDARGATVTYTYNNIGRLIRSESPWATIMNEDGGQASVRPTEYYYYDHSGRLVASRDANGNLTRRTLLAGTGYGGAAALVTSEIHADGGIKQTKYDIQGDARELIDERGHRTLQTFDLLGRVTTRQELRDPVTTTDDYYDYYVWDSLGQQVKHGSNAWSTPVYGEGYWVVDWYDYDTGQEYGHWEYPIIGYTLDWETTDYDIQGRVVSRRAFGGDVTTVAYAWNGGLSTSGLAQLGGWTQTTTMANGLIASQSSDLVGRVIAKTDLGGHTTSFTYDAAARLVSTGMNGMVTGFTWLNTGWLGRMTIETANAGQVNTDWTRETASYVYDATGNRIAETMVREMGDYEPGYSTGPWWEPEWVPETYVEYTTTVKQQSATWDALGRMTSWAEAGTTTSPAASTSMWYDAAGNIRRTSANHQTLDAYGSASGTSIARDYWFRYDTMNRMVVNQGVLDNGAIVRGLSGYGGNGGQEIAYDVAGRRMSVTTTGWYGDTKELYAYDGAGRLIETRQLDGTGATGAGILRSSYGYDLAGHQTSQTDYDAGGYSAVYSRSATYNAKGQLGSDYTSSLKSDGKTYTASTSYDYGTGSGYALGAVTFQSSSSWVSGSGGGSSWSNVTNGYLWYDGALQSTIGQANGGAGGNTNWNTSLSYDGLGRLASAYVADGKPRLVSYVNDELGQIIRRDESGVTGQTGAPHEVWYRYGGRQLGYTGNNGTSDLGTAASIEDRRTAAPPSNQGTFRNRQLYGGAYADFAQSYDPLNSYGQGSAPGSGGGSYTVQRGDTLQGIAQAMWGDVNLWYKIAEANGLGAGAALIEGQRLTLPTGVVRTAHNADSFRPYDPANAIGDLTPGTAAQAKKAKSNKCGAFGAILLAVVAVAVAAYLGPQFIGAAAKIGLDGTIVINATGLTAIFGGAGAAAGSAAAIGAGVVGGTAAGALGSIASQAVGVASGIQEKFSFKGVALAALAGGIGGGLSGSGLFGNAAGKTFEVGSLGIKSGIVDGAVRGVAANALGQGVGLATGLQSKFDFVGVAVGGAVGAGSSLVPGGGFLDRLGSGMAGALAGGAARSLIDGSDFGDNVLAALPDVIGSTIGSAIANGLSQRSAPPAREQVADLALGKLANGFRRVGYIPQAVQSDSSDGQASGSKDSVLTVTVWGQLRTFKTFLKGLVGSLSDPANTFLSYLRGPRIAQRIRLAGSYARDLPDTIARYGPISMALDRFGYKRTAAWVRGGSAFPGRLMVDTVEGTARSAVGGLRNAHTLVTDPVQAGRNLAASVSALPELPDKAGASVRAIVSDIRSDDPARIESGVQRGGVVVVDVGSIALGGVGLARRGVVGVRAAGGLAAETVVGVPKGSANAATRAAASRGSTLHSDQPGMLPDQLRAMYPDTQFEFTKPGVAGQDVRIVGGDHPFSYGTSSWPDGVKYGDFKPGTAGGAKTFRYDQNNKWSDPTHFLPYDPVTGKLLPH